MKSKNIQTKNYKFRVYPNEQQIELFNKTAGCRRLIWNMFLNLHEEDYKLNGKSLSKFDAIKLLSSLKKQEGYTFLSCLSKPYQPQRLASF